jgi:hypothetical protein
VGFVTVALTRDEPHDIRFRVFKNGTGNEMSIPGDVFGGSLTEESTRGAVMRKKWTLTAAAVGVCTAIAAPTGLASAEENAQATINRLQDEGYTVHIDRVGTAPMSECVVTNVRNPKQITQWVPYIGPGRNNDDRAMVLEVVSQSISVTLDCNRN